MLREDYNIRIVGRQEYENEEKGEISVSTAGSYIQRGGTRFISYREYEPEDSKASCTSVLKVEPDKVTLIRSGSATRLVLEKGRRHLCLYDTGYGHLTVGVYTSELSSSLDENGGRLAVKYTMDIDSNFLSRNEITVEVEPRL